MRKSAAKLLCAATLAGIAGLWSAPASAQRVTRIVAFGDSYADTGNLFKLLGIAPPSVYASGRFSGGTNFVDTMSQLLAVPDDNFAIGGAFTNNGNINGPGIPGFVTEYQSFLAGGGPAAFPRVTGKFGPTDLLVISIGGNDARAYERSLGVAPTSAQLAGLLAGAPAQAQTKVVEATAGLNALVAAGARNITFLAGDTGRLPEVNGLAIAQVGSLYSGTFNTGMQATLAGYANQGVIVNYLDLNKVGDVVGGQPRRLRAAERRRLPGRLRHHQSRAARQIPLLCRPASPDLGRVRDRRPLCGPPARSAAPFPGADRGGAAGGRIVRLDPVGAARSRARAGPRRAGSTSSCSPMPPAAIMARP